jgi:hypothetical protein
LIFFVSPDRTIDEDGLLFYLIFDIAADAPAEAYSVGLQLKDGQARNFGSYVAEEDHVGVQPVDLAFAPDGGVVIVSDKIIPTIDDLDYTIPSSSVYNSTARVATATAKPGRDFASVTVYYKGSAVDAVRTATAPADADNYIVSVDIEAGTIYGQATNLILGSFTITKAPAPSITWATASAITYGDALSAVVQSGGTSGYGEFAFDASVDLTQVLDADTYNLPVNFVASADTIKNYEAITTTQQNVEVVVNQAPAPALTWPTASYTVETYALSTVELVGGTEGYGTFNWTNPTLLPTAPGTSSYGVTFTPSEKTVQNYLPFSSYAADVSLQVYLLGDIDKDNYVSGLDLLLLARIAVGLEPAPANTTIDYKIANIDKSDGITATDTIAFMRKMVGLSY